MDSRRLKLCIVFLYCAEFCYQVQSVTFTTSVSPSPAVIGNTSRHTITCHFSFNTAESFQQLGLYIESTSNLYVGVLFNNDNPLWANTAPENLKNRGYLEGSRDEGFLSLVLNDTVCGDKDVVFLCNLQFFQSGEVKTEQRSASVSVEAAPTAPNAMVFIPRTNPAAQFSTMTFECRGNVGRPAASFQWYRFIGTGAGAGEEITDDRVVQDNEVLATDGCTYIRRSTLTLNLTGTEVNQNLVVRCRVNHATQGNPDTTACNDPDKEFCRNSEQISVQYPVTVTITPDTQQSEEGLNLNLTCITKGNPLPFLVEWRQEGQNTTLATGNTLQLTNLSLVDTGSYICTGYNTVVGFNKTHSASVYLSVVKTTTPAPTTTTVSTSTSSTSTGEGGSQSPNTGGPGDDTTTIIIVVVVVVLVIIIVVVIVVFVVMRRRRNKKGVEEPPEKPNNNNAGINAVATRPDLVSSSYSNTLPYKNEDGLAYAELQFDNKPRSRRPLAIDDSQTDYSDVSMPQV